MFHHRAPSATKTDGGGGVSALIRAAGDAARAKVIGPGAGGRRATAIGLAWLLSGDEGRWPVLERHT
jgi:hypothetical protein